MAANKAAKTNTEVATATSSALAFGGGADVPEYLRNGKGRGSEEVQTKDMVLPRLEIVQALSPIKDDRHETYNPEAKEGDLFNTVTGELLGDHIFFVPIYFRVEWLVWKDKDAGGGFFGSFATQEQAMDRRKQVVENDDEDADMIEVVDTPVQFGIIVDPDNPAKMEQIVISMARTKARVSRRWNSMIQIAGGDRFSRVYEVGTMTDENKKKERFKNFTVKPAGFTPEPIFRKCEELYANFASNEVKVNHEAGGPDTADTGPEGGRGNRGEI